MECNYFDELFGGELNQSDVDAGLAKLVADDAARIAEVVARNAAYDAARIASRCPKCAGSGCLSQFAHRKGGVCFTCGGSGILSRA